MAKQKKKLSTLDVLYSAIEDIGYFVDSQARFFEFLKRKELQIKEGVAKYIDESKYDIEVNILAGGEIDFNKIFIRIKDKNTSTYPEFYSTTENDWLRVRLLSDIKDDSMFDRIKALINDAGLWDDLYEAIEHIDTEELSYAHIDDLYNVGEKVEKILAYINRAFRAELMLNNIHCDAENTSIELSYPTRKLSVVVKEEAGGLNKLKTEVKEYAEGLFDVEFTLKDDALFSKKVNAILTSMMDLLGEPASEELFLYYKKSELISYSDIAKKRKHIDKLQKSEEDRKNAAANCIP